MLLGRTYTVRMTTISSPTTLQERREPLAWGSVIAATLLAAGTIALIWLAAVPFGPVVCPAIYPAPASCFASSRVGNALIATVVVAVVYAVTMYFALAGERRHRGFVIAGTSLLAIAPIVSYLAVAFIPGFAVGGV